MKIKRVLYLGYYLKGLDREKLGKFLRYVSQSTGISRLRLLAAAVAAVFKYNISILDYFLFRFYELPEKERLLWAGTGFMFEYQKKMNPVNVRGLLEDKLSFHQRYGRFTHRGFASLSQITKDPGLAQVLIDKPAGKLVLKNSLGQAGKEISVIDSRGLRPAVLIETMKAGNFDLVEEFIVQHPDMEKLSDSGINTARLITQVDEGKVEILAARLRITIDSFVDNLAAGNAAAPVDPDTGKVVGPAVFSDIVKSDITVHPLTKVQILDFQIPFWKEALAMVREAALVVPGNRSVGWDVAFTSKGPLLIEGNHNWCKILWQLPVKKGLKPELEKFL
jgi:hypothetical protein